MAVNALRAMRDSQQAADKGDASTRSPDPKRNRPEASQINDAESTKLDESQHAMVTMIGKMMDDKLGRFETWTQSKFDNMQTQMDVVASATDKGMKEMKKDADETKQHVKELQSTVHAIQQNMEKRQQQPTDEDERDLQAIVHGFAKETNEEDIIKKVTEVIETHGLSNQIKEIFTFTDPASIGVISFHNKEGMSKFFRRMRDVDIELGSGKSMSWSKNETLEQRVLEKPLGYIKFYLHEKLKIPLKHVRIDRNKQTVKIQGRLIAKNGGSEVDYGIIFMGEASEVKQEVKTAMATWLAKTNQTE